MDGIYIRMDKNSETFCRNIKAIFFKNPLGYDVTSKTITKYNEAYSI